MRWRFGFCYVNYGPFFQYFQTEHISIYRLVCKITQLACDQPEIGARNFCFWRCIAGQFHDYEHIYMRPEVNSNRFEISLRDKISRRCEVTSLLAFTWLRRSETHFGANFTSVKLTEVKFQTVVIFPCKQ